MSVSIGPCIIRASLCTWSGQYLLITLSSAYFSITSRSVKVGVPCCPARGSTDWVRNFCHLQAPSYARKHWRCKATFFASQNAASPVLYREIIASSRIAHKAVLCSLRCCRRCIDAFMQPWDPENILDQRGNLPWLNYTERNTL